jgi:ubiquinone/menaquinone biosynthesis C-methylase UbiE
LNLTTNIKPVLAVDPDWWDGRHPDSFFPAVYRRGDGSREGYLVDVELSLDARTSRESELVQSFLNLPNGAAVLDCPCGYGRHSIALARRGFHVTGVDLCPSFIAEARTAASALQTPGSCRILAGDMRSLPLPPAQFDACLNLFLAFGFFDDAGNQRCLSEFARVLKPGGQLLIHTDVNPDRAVAGTFEDRTFRSLPDGGTLEVNEVYDSSSHRLVGTWTVAGTHAGNGALTRGYSIRIYSHRELSDMLQTAGFHPPQVISINSAGKPATDADAQEVLYVAHKA